MKKKMMVTALSSMFVLGSLAACGGEGGNDTTDVENDPAANEEMDNGMENDPAEGNE
jgi:hypothetical protein